MTAFMHARMRVHLYTRALAWIPAREHAGASARARALACMYYAVDTLPVYGFARARACASVQAYVQRNGHRHRQLSVGCVSVCVRSYAYPCVRVCVHGGGGREGVEDGL